MNFTQKTPPFSKYILLLIFALSLHDSIAQKIEYDKKIGKEKAQAVLNQMGLYENKAMNDYITKVGNRLVAELEEPLFEYHFYLVTNSEPNAFALPGGYIFITTGLIPILQTEDELACIIGHEIIHSNNRHSIKQMRKGILPTILAIPGAILGIVSDNLGAIFQAPSHLMVAGYSRKYETEADVEGVALAIKAGYNPNALKDALTRMTSTIEIAYDNKEEKSYFSDHPYTPDRVSKINKVTEGVELSLKAPIKKDYAPIFNGVIYGNHPENGVIINQSILNPTLNYYIQFPENWQLAVDAERAMGVKKEQDAILVFAEETEFSNPDSAAAAFLNKIPEKQRKDVLKTTFPKKGILEEGVLIAMRETTNKGSTFAHILWLPYQGKLLKVATVSTKEQLETLRTIVRGMRPLTETEKNSVKIRFMSTKTSSGNETLEQLAKKGNNKLEMKLLESINDTKASEKPKKNVIVKIINEKTFLVNP